MLVQALAAIERIRQHLESVIRHRDLRIRVRALRVRAPAFYTRMDHQSQVMTLAVGASVLFHCVVLLVHFSYPDSFQFDTQQLDVVLVNSKSSTRPFYADARAQANLDGGGNTDKKRRAKTPLPALNRAEKGDALAQTLARQKQLEVEQRQLIAQLQASATALPQTRTIPSDSPIPQPAGQDLATNSLAIAKLEAQIAQQVEEYQQRPRKAFVGARAQEWRFAQYVDDWRVKVERIGNLNYPEAAKGHDGSLRFTISIRSNGTIEGIQIDRSSGTTILDEAAKKILRMAAPYAAFPPALADTDILVITRTMIFSPGDHVSSE